VRCLSTWWRDREYYHRVPWAGKRHFDGLPTLDGAMVNQSVHYLNQMLNLAQRTGEADIALPAEIRASLYRFHAAADLEVEDTVVAKGALDNDDHTEFLFAATTCASESAGADRAGEYRGLPERHHIILEGELGTARWDGMARIDKPGQPPQIFDESEPQYWPFYFHLQRVLRGEEAPITVHPAEAYAGLVGRGLKKGGHACSFWSCDDFRKENRACPHPYFTTALGFEATGMCGRTTRTAGWCSRCSRRPAICGALVVGAGT